MNDGVMITLLPIVSDWCKIDVPHMTLVYAGKEEDLTPAEINQLAKDTADLALLSSPMYFRVKGVETFGDGSDSNPLVDVFTLQPTPELMAMRRSVEGWNASEFPFRPHCTIGPAGGVIENRPMTIAFDRLMVAWGDNQLIFNLKRY